MLFFPSFKLKAIITIAQIFLLLSLLVQLNLAGVIKKRDLAEIATSFSSLSQNDPQISPTILSAVANESENASTILKLQPAISSFATESSKELTFNEIALNEAKKLIDKELKNSTLNQTFTATKDEDDQKAKIEEKLKLSQQNEEYENLQQNFSSKGDNNKLVTLNDPLIHEKIETNLENISQQLSEKLKISNPIVTTTTQFGSNVIQEEEEEKLKKKTDEMLDNTKLTDRFKQLESSKTEKDEDNHLNSFENTIKAFEEQPRPPSQILKELKTETETATSSVKSEASKAQTISQNENSIETKLNADTKSDRLVNDHLENVKTVKVLEIPVTDNTNANKTSSFVSTLLGEEDNKIEAFNTARKESIDNQQIKLEDPKSESRTTESPNDATIISEYNNKSLKSDHSNQTDGENATRLTDLSEAHSNIINDGLDRDDFLKSSKLENIPETTSQPLEILETTLLPFNKEESQILAVNKLEYARSMSRESEDELKDHEEATTIQSNNDNEIELQYTTTKSSLNNFNKDTEVIGKAYTDESYKNKESRKENTEENVTLKDKLEESSYNSLKLNEKKAKFINDNSTNVQHLNLPNNAESWNLASMKPLIKENVTMETAHKQNISNEIKDDSVKNTTYAINSISEKNLLDWSKVMNDKDYFFTTIQNQNEQQLEKEEEATTGNIFTNEDTTLITTTEWERHHEVPDITTTQSSLQILNQPSIESREDRPKINSFIEQDFTNPTTTTSTTLKSNSTILSHSSDNINNEEDKQTNSMNNHIILETLKETENTANTENTSKIQLNINNPSMIIEPILSVTNLTSNHTQQQMANNEADTTMTTGKQNLNEDANVDTTENKERATATATEATAGVVDMMTTILEQNAIELTTLSTLETSKQNASGSNVYGVVTQQQQNNNNNEISHDDLEKTVKPYQKIDLETLIFTTTTTEIPITTYRPKNLPITFTTTTTTTPSFKQEVDQNGNNENQTEQKQSIITTVFEGGNNSKPIETHLSELELETTTTLETITEINPTTLTTTTTTSVENNTSSSIDETINEQIIKQIKVTTPKSEDNEKKEDVIYTTTIGSPVIETKFEKDLKEDILTTTAATSTSTTLETPKTPVVVVNNTETQESSTVETLIEEDKNNKNTQTNQGSDNTQENTENPKENQEQDKAETDNNNETTTTMAIYPLNTTSTTTMKTEDETIKINLLDDTTTTTTTSQPILTTTVIQQPTTTLTESTTTTTTTTPLPITTTLEDIYKVIYTTTTETIPTTTLQISTESEELFSSSSTIISNMIPPTTTTVSSLSTKIIETADIGKSLPTLTTIMGGNSGNMYPKNTEVSGETDVNVIIAITVSVIGVVALVLLVGFLYLMRKRQKQTSYSQRCRPVSLDEYTIDNASVGGSMRKTSALRSSKRTYGNLAFDDPSLRHNAMGVHELAKFAQEKLRIFEEFRDVPQITSRLDEVPLGCEDKNRYANVLPLPETRVILQRLNDDDKTEYINANYVTGPKDPPNYFIACQAPLDTTVEDFWRMIWEQQSRVIIQATDLIENGVEKCAEYLPPSVTLDNHSTFGDFQITLQNREVKDKYAISTILLKYVTDNSTRELTHYWYKWPEVGVPAEEAPLIAMLLEARSSLISYAIEQANEDKEKSSTATLKSVEEGTVSANGTTTSPSKDSNGSSANGSNSEINGNISMVNIKKTARNQGPLTIHCSPGTGRTGTIIACDIAIRSLETPKRTVDIPQIVYYVRRGRASAVLTKEQYEFIYKVANMYAAKITNPTSYN